MPGLFNQIRHSKGEGSQKITVLKIFLKRNCSKISGMEMNLANQKHNQICSTNLKLILQSDPLHFLSHCFYQSEMNYHNGTGIKQ